VTVETRWIVDLVNGKPLAAKFTKTASSEPTGKRSFIRLSKSGVGPNDLGRPRPIGGVESEQAKIRSAENTARPIFRRINIGSSLPQATNGCFVASISTGSLTAVGRTVTIGGRKINHVGQNAGHPSFVDLTLADHF
jgi:hypothetical protein